MSTAQLAAGTGIPLPTVAKLTGLLARANLLQSQRGTSGGFLLARAADAISLADIIEAIDGPIALTHCADGGHDCTFTGQCAVKPHWEPVNRAVRSALSDVSLAALAPQSGFPAALAPQPRIFA